MVQLISYKLVHHAMPPKGLRPTWLRDHSRSWPSPENSPDHRSNPTENCWNFLKNQLRNRDISSVLRLKEEIMKICMLELSLKHFKSLTDSMPLRMQQVIQAEGDMTKY
jgi:hypothetical protein